MRISEKRLRQIIREELLHESNDRREANKKAKLKDALSAIPTILSFIGLIESAADAHGDPDLRKLAQTAHRATLAAMDKLKSKRAYT